MPRLRLTRAPSTLSALSNATMQQVVRRLAIQTHDHPFQPRTYLDVSVADALAV